MKPQPQDDYNHGKLIAAIDTFIAAKRTAAAYAELAQKVIALRPGMDATVAEEAELRMIVLALDPMTAQQGRSDRCPIRSTRSHSRCGRRCSRRRSKPIS